MFLFCSYFLISVVFHTFKKHENLLPQINNAHFIVDLKDNYFMTIYTDKEMNISTLHNFFCPDRFNGVQGHQKISNRVKGKLYLKIIGNAKSIIFSVLHDYFVLFFLQRKT